MESWNSSEGNPYKAGAKIGLLGEINELPDVDEGGAIQDWDHFQEEHLSDENERNQHDKGKNWASSMECPDYNFGFCFKGPQCKLLHVRKPEHMKPEKVSESYIQKVFQQLGLKDQGMMNSQQQQLGGMMNNDLLYAIFDTMMSKNLESQSVKMSSGTFSVSDAFSERSKMITEQFELDIENTRHILKGRIRFFIIKSFNFESINMSVKHEVWSTSAGPTKKLTNAFKSSDYVVLIFSVNESRSFQGFALMVGEPDPNYKPECFKKDNNSQIQFADNFPVKWIIECDYPFYNLQGFPGNPMNDNLPVKQSKNGQELPFKLGNYLCQLLVSYNHHSVRVLNKLEDFRKQFNPSQGVQRQIPRKNTK